MNVDWDPAKNRTNHAKHGISFEDAKAVYHDPDRLEVLDHREYGEERWAVIGAFGRVIIYVIYTERSGSVRLISARKATPDEEADYYAAKPWR
jgi:uncharacterized DUF497 family protein